MHDHECFEKAVSVEQTRCKRDEKLTRTHTSYIPQFLPETTVIAPSWAWPRKHSNYCQAYLVVSNGNKGGSSVKFI